MNLIESSPSGSQSLCTCEDGYFYSPHSSGEPIRSPCPSCRPEECNKESTSVLVIVMLIPIILLVLAVLSST